MSLIDYAGSLSLSDEIKLLNQAVLDQKTSRYLDVAAVSVMIYDILITIDQESLLIWKSRWSHGKIIYIITRYPVAIEGILWLIYSIDLNAPEILYVLCLYFTSNDVSWFLHSITSCKFEAYLAIWGTLVFLIPLQILIILRTMAVWDRKHIVVLFLVAATIATDAAIVVTLSRIMRDFKFSFTPLLRPILGCDSGLLRISPTLSVPSWSATIAFDTTIFVLTFMKALHSFRVGRDRLLTILIRDGFVYYAVMLGLGVSNLVLLSALPVTRAGLGVALTPVLRASYSIIGSRLVLNLRGAASSNLGLGTQIEGDGANMNSKLIEMSMTTSGSTTIGQLETGSRPDWGRVSSTGTEGA